jgi:16S rRNA G966 N2-methylase RsmD
MYNPALKALLDANMIKSTTLIVCESGAEEIFNGDINLQTKFETAKQSKYGNTFITILKLKD